MSVRGRQCLVVSKFAVLGLLVGGFDRASASALNFFSSVSADYSDVVAALFTTLLFCGVGLVFKRNASAQIASGDVAPAGKLGLFSVVEQVLGFVQDLAREQCGKYEIVSLRLMVTLFLYILLANLSGLVPGFPPVTESFSANLAMGLLVFLFYNYVGVREHGASYIKQFTGPFLLLAVLMFPLEVISHCSRPLSLGFRLTVNIFADHLLLGVFGDLLPIVVPVIFLFFGLLVCFIQSFVFTLLTSIYIGMAASHDH